MVQKSATDFFYSLPEVWDFCLEKIYDKKEYVRGFLGILTKHDIGKQSLILDAGCGSGFPSIELIKKGYRIIGVDKSSEMVRQVQLNAKKRGVSIEAYHVMWSELSKWFDSIFDSVYCRGNSLVYAASWEQNWIVPGRSKEELRKALQNFYRVLKPKGWLYLDVTNKNEKPHREKIGRVKTPNGALEITWEIEHDWKNHIRTWTLLVKSLRLGKQKKYASYSYLLSQPELLRLLKETGFKKIEKNVRVKGEKNYSVFMVQR